MSEYYKEKNYILYIFDECEEIEYHHVILNILVSGSTLKEEIVFRGDSTNLKQFNRNRLKNDILFSKLKEKKQFIILIKINKKFKVTVYDKFGKIIFIGLTYSAEEMFEMRKAYYKEHGSRRHLKRYDNA